MIAWWIALSTFGLLSAAVGCASIALFQCFRVSPSPPTLDAPLPTPPRVPHRSA